MNIRLGKISRLLALPATVLAQRAKRAGHWEAAARYYRIALACDPENAAKQVQCGNALRECGALTQAEKAYRRSLELNSRSPDAYVQLGHVLKLQDRGYDAIAAYRKATDLDPFDYEASLELLGLGSATHVVPLDARPAPECVVRTGQRLIAFDTTDLLDHVQRRRSATGIQRVQACVVASLLHEPATDVQVIIAYFQRLTDEWIAIPADLFLCLIDLVQLRPASQDPIWRKTMRQLIALTVHGERLQFPDDAVIVNLGSSWTSGNYFLRIRTVKARRRLKYVPFVHDCIPALFPDLCAPDTVRDYLGWISGVFRHADGFLVNSAATALDLSRVAALLGHAVASPYRVPLDADFQTDPEEASTERSVSALEHCRVQKPFVLFVATFERRKNHLAAFRAWLRLIECRGRRNTPLLVCVGARGWNADAAMKLLHLSKALRRKVKILSDVSDRVLSGLYRECLFTLYPSVYEGWGLPVTESLFHGKVPLITSVSGLREAGGDLAEYFDPHRDGDLVTKLQRLIDDPGYLASRETAIRHDFRGRRWREVSQGILDSLRSMGASHETRNFRAFPIEVGRYYSMARNSELRLCSERVSGECYRMGEGWWPPEDWGCWLKPAGGELLFTLPPVAGGPHLQLDLVGNLRQATEVTITVADTLRTARATLGPEERRKIAVPLGPRIAPNSPCRIWILASGSCSLGEATSGLDQRVVSVGLRGFSLMRHLAAAAPGVVATRHDADLPI